MPELPVLTYHRIGDTAFGPPGITISISEFTQQMDLLTQGGYVSLGLGNFIRMLRGREEEFRKRVLITFDDGYGEVYSGAWPILKERGLTATGFITTGAIGGTNFWDSSGSSLAMLTEGQIKELGISGMDFGAHTHTHPELPNLSGDRAREEVRRSKAVLENLLGRPVLAFCYPYGRCSPELKRILSSEGFACSFASDTGPRDFREDPFEIRRIGIFPGLTQTGFLRKISGYYHRYRKLTGR